MVFTGFVSWIREQKKQIVVVVVLWFVLVVFGFVVSSQDTPWIVIGRARF